MLQSVILIDPNATLSAKPDSNTLVIEPKTGESVISIDQIRQLISWVGQHGFAPGAKRAIVLQAQRWHFTAPEALLKTLEEPPTDTTIILTVDQASSLPLTIRSRCATLHLDQVCDSQLTEWNLSSVAPLDLIAPIDLTDFLELTPIERWLAIEPWLKAKTNLAEWLLAWQRQADQLVINPEVVSRQQAIQQAILDQRANIQPRLVMDNLLLSLETSS